MPISGLELAELKSRTANAIRTNSLVGNVKGHIENLKAVLGTLPYDSLLAESAGKNFLRVNIPKKYKATHEDHFGQVTSRFLEYMNDGNLPEWEVPGMITKYYTITRALKMAKGE